MKKNLTIYIAIGIASLALGGIFSVWHREKIPQTPAEFPALTQLFSLSLPDQHGKAQQLAHWRGKTLVINFWATWCPPCVEEMPALSDLQAKAGENIQFLGIGVDSAANINQFSSKFNIVYPLFAAGMEGTELSRQFGNQSGGLPFTVLIGQDGQVKKTYLGRVKLDELRKDLALP